MVRTYKLKDEKGNSLIDQAHKQSKFEDRATPYTYFDGEPKPSSVNGQLVADSCSYSLPQTTDDMRRTFYSKSVLVRYVDEFRELDDAVQFRMDFASIEAAYEPVGLCIALERADVTDLVHGQEGNGNEKFEILCARFFHVNNVCDGLHQYFPVVFDNCSSLGFAVVEAMIHSCVTNLHFESGHITGGRVNVTLAEYIWARYCSESHPDLTDSNPKFNESLETHAEKIRMSWLYSVRKSYSGLKKNIDWLIENEPSRKEPPPADVKDDGNYLKPLDPKPAFTRLRDKSEQKNQYTLKKFADEFSEELGSWCSKLLLSWHAYLNEVKVYSHEILTGLKRKWLQSALDRAGEVLINERLDQSEYMTAISEDRLAQRREIATKIRTSAARIREFEKEKVQDFEMFEDSSTSVVLFQQVYTVEAERKSKEIHEFEHTKPPLPPPATNNRCRGLSRTEGCKLRDFLGEGKHLVVLVHGFMGSSWDLRQFRNYLAIIQPDVMSLLSAANEEDTDSDIRILGVRLSREIHEFVKEYNSTNKIQISKISFVCHSIGSVIVRSALTEEIMLPYISKLCSLVSLSSPHLGTKGMSSSIVKAGMWAIRHWRKSKALSQLALQDADNVEDTFLYKLSKQDRGGLKDFKNVFLLGSPQDQYIPYFSARVEFPVEGDSISETCCRYATEMCKNILGKVDPENLVRLDLHFQFDSGNTKRVDKMIGRAAHVRILDSPALALLIILNYHERLFPIC